MTTDPVEYLTWNFQVGWGGGLVNEASRLIDMEVRRGRDFLLTTGGGWQRYAPGELVATFDNSDGRFDYNGPLSGVLRTGRRVRVAVTVQAPFAESGTVYQVMRGIVDDVQNFFRDGEKLTRIVVKDGLEWLSRRTNQLALVTEEEALLTGSAIAGTIGFSSFDDWSITQLGTDSVIVPYAFGNDSALTLINQLVDAEAGQVFHSRAGALTFITNDYTGGSATELDQAQLLRDFEIRAPWDTVRTRASIVANPLVEGSAEVLWTFGNEGVTALWEAEPNTNDIVTLPNLFGELPPAITTDAIFSTDGGAATSPTVDYEAVIADGNTFDDWLDISADPDLDLVTTDIGTGLRLAWTWNGGGSYTRLVITFADITASPLERGATAIAIAQDATAITTYGEKTFTLDCPWIQNQTYAQAYADWVVSILKDPDFYPVIQIEGRGDLQFSFELYDKIDLTIPALGIDDTYRVGKISHKWLKRNGFSVRTTLSLEPVLAAL